MLLTGNGVTTLDLDSVPMGDLSGGSSHTVTPGRQNPRVTNLTAVVAHPCLTQVLLVLLFAKRITYSAR